MWSIHLDTHIGKLTRSDKLKEESSLHCLHSPLLECFGNIRLPAVYHFLFDNIDANTKKSYYILKAGKNIEGNGNINIGYEHDKY